MCKVIKLSRSTYCKYKKNIVSSRSIENTMISKVILNIYNENKGRYGAPKIHKKLEGYSINISLKRVQRLMSKLNIKSIITRKYKPYSSKSKAPDLVNIINRDFVTTDINQKWLTYIHTKKDSWCYLASVMDLHTRKIIGYAMSRNIDAKLAIDAIKDAVYKQKPSNQLILHSDLGSQYTSIEFSTYVKKQNIRHSFSRKGNPYDNAPIESFHASLKKEEVNTSKYIDFKSAKLVIFEYIESWYNRKRIHSSIGYITPQLCEDQARKSA